MPILLALFAGIAVFYWIAFAGDAEAVEDEGEGR
jgi:hypothetical protein